MRKIKDNIASQAISFTYSTTKSKCFCHSVFNVGHLIQHLARCS